MLVASEIKVIRSLFTCCHHILQFSDTQILVDRTNGFLYQFLTIIMNSIDIPMVDFLPQLLELILAERANAMRTNLTDGIKELRAATANIDNDSYSFLNTGRRFL